MTTTDLDQTREQVGNHLRFLGYEVSIEDRILFARHPTKSNIMVQVFIEGILMLTIFNCTDTAREDRAGYLELINSANEGAGVVRYFADRNSAFFIQAWYTGDYRQVDFGRFLELWYKDIEKLGKLPGVERYLR